MTKPAGNGASSSSKGGGNHNNGNEGGRSNTKNNGKGIISMKHCRVWIPFILLLAWNANETKAWFQERRNTSTDPSSEEISSYRTQQQRQQYKYPPYMVHNLVSNHQDELPQSSQPQSTGSITPVFYHIPKTGGTSIKNMYGECYDELILATEVGILNGHDQDTSLQIVNIDNLNGRYVNVDTTTSGGIDKAAAFQLVPSHKANLIVTPLLHESISKLFYGHDSNLQQQQTEKARLFTILRHPIDRQVSLFYYLQRATWEPTYNTNLQSMTLEDYVNSTWVEENYVVRSLVNKMEGPLDESHDLNMAKMLLRDNFLIGILDENHHQSSLLEESVRRFDTYFGWKPTNKECQLQYLQHGVNRGAGNDSAGDSGQQHQEQNRKQRPSEGSLVYKKLQLQNMLDIELYEYAKNELFPEQAALIQQQQQQQASQTATTV